MKTFIVAYINWFDHELVQERVTAEDWRDAFTKHSKANELWPTKASVPDDAEEARQHCFDCDCMMDAFEVTP